MGATWAQQKELRLGRYVLKRPLGEGGNGQVFLAWQENEAGEPLVCVVKFPLQRFATQADGRERFLAEARLAMRLGMHPNIVHVIDVGRHRDMPFIVMEYVDGTDLHHLLNVLRGAKQGLSLASAYNILASTAEALHHAHAGATIAGKPVGVVHRDIKPGNILVTRDGATKVGDFGIGATIEEGTSGQYMRGTHRYMSPEHLRCEVRPEMDLYALGVVAWEILENRQFREGVKGPQHFSAIMGRPDPADAESRHAQAARFDHRSVPRAEPTVQHRTGLDRHRACGIALDVARALVGLHERGIVHRDIKPSNVVVTTEGRARLLDFGLAYATGDGWEQKSPDLTEEGHAPGTPLYMSPEQATHVRPSPAFDAYSFGVMLYELLSGNPPLDTMPLGALLGLKCDPSWRPFPIAKMCPDVPTHVTDLVDRCLAFDPGLRPSAAELVAALENTPPVLRGTPHELRLVPFERASVIAEGAREAGDETRADIVRKAIPLPSVKAAVQAAAAVGAMQPMSARREQVPTEPAPAPARIPPSARATTEPSPRPEPHLRPAPAPEPTPSPFATQPRWKLPVVGLGLGLFGAAAVYVVLALAGPSEPELSGRSERAVTEQEEPAPEPDAPAAGSGSPREPEPDVDSKRPAVADPPRTPDAEPEPPAPRASDPPRKRIGPAREPAAKAKPSCDEQRKQATEARANKKWSAVLASTTDAACWSDAKSERARLRVEALMRLGRHKACAKEAFRSADPTVVQWGEECFRRAEDPADAEGGAP